MDSDAVVRLRVGGTAMTVDKSVLDEDLSAVLEMVVAIEIVRRVGAAEKEIAAARTGKGRVRRE